MNSYKPFKGSRRCDRCKIFTDDYEETYWKDDERWISELLCMECAEALEVFTDDLYLDFDQPEFL